MPHLKTMSHAKYPAMFQRSLSLLFSGLRWPKKSQP